MADPSFAPPSRIVVAGASLAGLSAAEALREFGYCGDLVPPLVRGRRVIGEDFATLQLEHVGRCIDALPIPLASVEIDDNLHDCPSIRLASERFPADRMSK